MSGNLRGSTHNLEIIIWKTSAFPERKPRRLSKEKGRKQTLQMPPAGFNGFQRDCLKFLSGDF